MAYWGNPGMVASGMAQRVAPPPSHVRRHAKVRRVRTQRRKGLLRRMAVGVWGAFLLGIGGGAIAGPIGGIIGVVLGGLCGIADD